MNALSALESAGLRVMIARTEAAIAPAGRRIVKLELAGPDRPGIVRELATSLADRGVSIEDLHTELVDGPGGAHVFKVRALLFVPNAVTHGELQRALDALASEMRLDLALGERDPASG